MSALGQHSRLAQEGGAEEQEPPRRRSTLLTVCPFILVSGRRAAGGQKGGRCLCAGTPWQCATCLKVTTEASVRSWQALQLLVAEAPEPLLPPNAGQRVLRAARLLRVRGRAAASAAGPACCQRSAACVPAVVGCGGAKGERAKGRACAAVVPAGEPEASHPLLPLRSAAAAACAAACATDSCMHASAGSPPTW